MALDDIRYDSIKEAREWYYVVYFPPMSNYAFSILSLTIEDQDASVSKVAQVMEQEAAEWVNRFNVPVMVSAFTIEDDLLRMEGVRPSDHLMAWSNECKTHIEWRLVPNEELPVIALDTAYIRRIFADVQHRTGAQVHAEVRDYTRQMRVGWWLVFAWAVVVPLGVAVLEWRSELLGYVVLTFAFIKAGIKALKLTGRLPDSDRDEEKKALELRMRHHHYHCERNPEGFAQLKADNFRKEAADKSRAEASRLRGGL